MRATSLTATAVALLLAACVNQDSNARDEMNAPTGGTAEAGPTASVGSGGNGTAPPPPDGHAPGQSDGNTAQPEPSGDVTLAASPATTSAGATMTLTLRNGSSGEVGYNLCTSSIQTSAGKPVQTDRVCTMELRTLGPGKSIDYSYELPDDLASGSYRFLTQVEKMAARTRSGVRSNLFAVR